MDNYDIAALSSGFNRQEMHNIYNNNKTRTQINNTHKMMSSLDLTKNKKKNIQFEPISNRNFIPSQTQYNFNKRRERNSSRGNNELNYHLPRGGSQYNINALRKANNKLERENLNIMNDNLSIKLPEKKINNYYKSRSGFPLSKQLNSKTNFNLNIRPYNNTNNANNINTSPNENMIMNNYNINNGIINNYEEEENNDEEIDNIANELDEYNYNNNNRNNTYDLLNENKALKIQLNKLFNDKTLIEKKANDIIKVNEEILKENKILKQQVNKLSNIVNSYRSNKMDNNKLIQMQQNLRQKLNEKDLIIKDLNKKFLTLNEDINKKQQLFSNNNTQEKNLIEKYEKEIKELKNNLEINKINIESTNKNINIYLTQIKSLKDELEQKNKEIKEKEKENNQINQQIIKELQNKLTKYENDYKTLEKLNSELTIQLNNKKENDLNDSDYRNKMNELEEKNEELKSELENKNKEIELYKNKTKEEKKANEDYANLKQTYENILKDCENFKKVNDILLDETNKYKKIISEYDAEKEALNKSLELLKQKNSKFETELKTFRKTEKNPFKVGEFELDPIKKEEARYSLGAKEARTEKYKKMLLDYETQNKNDLNQMNMLKADIKGLKSRLKEKEKKLGEIKVLIETGYKDINGKNKTQKDAIKRLKEILNENE